MAHYAEINTSNEVINVISGVDEVEKSGGEMMYLLATGNTWKRTSYNTVGGEHRGSGTPFRKNYAGIGYSYDKDRDAFIPPKQYPSWVLNEDTCRWDAPVAMPDDDQMYTWNEETTNWNLIEVE